VPTIVHLLLALVLTVFLAAQASALAFVFRSRRTVSARGARRRSDLLWTCIPVLLVLFLAARSWVAVVDVHRPAVAATGTPSPSVAAPALEEPHDAMTPQPSPAIGRFR
jgi:heme/copper-type cytochrome/quinol oxidase subunit 2